MKVYISVIALAAFSSLVACSDTDRASIGAIGSPGDIVCYSGGKIIYQGRSTGRIQTVGYSSNWEFKDSTTGKFVHVSGDCVIQN